MWKMAGSCISKRARERERTQVKLHLRQSEYFRSLFMKRWCVFFFASLAFVWWTFHFAVAFAILACDVLLKNFLLSLGKWRWYSVVPLHSHSHRYRISIAVLFIFGAKVYCRCNGPKFALFYFFFFLLLLSLSFASTNTLNGSIHLCWDDVFIHFFFSRWQSKQIRNEIWINRWNEDVDEIEERRKKNRRRRKRKITDKNQRAFLCPFHLCTR